MEREDLHLFVPGRPVPKARPRWTKKGGVYTPKTTVDWEKQIAAAAKEKSGARTPAEGEIDLSVTFLIPRPKTVKREKPTTRPDLDNLIKSVLDGINRANVWYDDSQVCGIFAMKRYATKFEQPGVHVSVMFATGGR